MSEWSEQKMREEAFRSCEAIEERHFTADALERQVKQFARYILDLTDHLALHQCVAHDAWHLMDDSGEADSTDDNGRSDYLHTGLDHERLSASLDALEVSGWDPHLDRRTEGGEPR